MSNLLDKASIVTTPTAYENGKILSVKPAPSLSSELISNGDFATDSDWTKLNATISGGTGNLNGTGVTSMLYQNILTNGKTYKVTFTASDYNSLGQARVIDNSGSAIYIITSNGTFTFTFTHSNANGNFLFRATAGAIFSIDNVSVKETIDGDFDFTRNSSATRVNSQGLIEDVQILSSNLVSNGDFSNGSTGWTVSNGTVTDKYNASMTAYQTGIRILPFSNTGTFKVVFDLVVTSGSCKFDAGGSNNAIYSTSGTKELIATNITKFEFNAFNLGWVGTLDNVSVIEITDDTNLPRIDYTGGVGHWLFEPQSTNLVTYSEVYGSGTYFSSFQGSTFDNTTSLSPSGENNATQLTSTGAGKLQTAGISLSQNTDYTLSFYAKNVDATAVTSRILGLGGSGGSNLTPISYFSELSTTEWKRITHSFNTGTNTTFYLYLLNALNSGGTIQLWGAQLEQSSFATSYIPTSGEANGVTRLQDAAFGAGSSDLINSTEGVLYAEIAALNSVTSPSSYITISDGTYNNRASIFFSSGATNQIRTFLRVGGASQIDVSNNVSDVTDFNKIAFSYKENNFKVYINGALVSTDTSGSVWSSDTITKLSFSEINTSVGSFQGKTKCLAVFKEALTDAELTCLTTI